MILINNSPHGNGVVTIRDEETRQIIKSSYTAAGIERLTREHSGCRWYIGRTNLTDFPELSLQLRGHDAYARLRITLVKGEAGVHSRPIRENRSRLLAAVQAYQFIWGPPTRQMVPLHGDFSLGNLIFVGDRVVVIDWEHFRPDAAPWGLDLVNMLYESVLMSFKPHATLPAKDRDAFLDVRRVICSLLDDRTFDGTYDALVGFVDRHACFWAGSVQKLPILHATEPQKRALRALELL